MKNRICATCSQDFKPSSKAAKFCGRKCYFDSRRGKDGPGQFKAGAPTLCQRPVGSVKVRTRVSRGGVQRAWVKVSQPNTWRLRAHVSWESANGPVPPGMMVHHKNRDPLDDDPSNLQLMTRAEHLAEHRNEHAASCSEGKRRAWKLRRVSGDCAGCGDAFTFDKFRPMTHCTICARRIRQAAGRARRRQRSPPNNASCA